MLECNCRMWAGDAKWLRAAAANPHAHHPACPRPTSVSEHAVDRYIERHQPNMAQHRITARKQLVVLMREAVIVDKDDEVTSVWRTTTGILLVVRDRVVSTVLPLGSQRPDRRPKFVVGTRRA